ncbi:transglutaminase family protein, partial [Rhizobium brockwellii]
KRKGRGGGGGEKEKESGQDARYIRVASGLCYRDAAQISGMRIGTPGETLSVPVKVEDGGQMQSQRQS